PNSRTHHASGDSTRASHVRYEAVTRRAISDTCRSTSCWTILFLVDLEAWDSSSKPGVRVVGERLTSPALIAYPSVRASARAVRFTESLHAFSKAGSCERGAVSGRFWRIPQRRSRPMSGAWNSWCTRRSGSVMREPGTKTEPICHALVTGFHVSSSIRTRTLEGSGKLSAS